MNNKISVPKIIKGKKHDFTLTFTKYDDNPDGTDNIYTYKVDNINGDVIFHTLAEYYVNGRYPETFNADFDYDWKMELDSIIDPAEVAKEIEEGAVAGDLVMYKFGPVVDMQTFLDFCSRCDAHYKVTVEQG